MLEMLENGLPFKNLNVNEFLSRLPYTFVTKEVAEATCDCLLEQAEQAELANQPQAMAERLILEEFGRCLRRIISFAGKAKTDCPINC